MLGKKKKRGIINIIATVWRENMLGYLSLEIICSSKLTVFLELRSGKLFESEQIMSADKYPRIIPRQMEAIVFVASKCPKEQLREVMSIHLRDQL